MDAAISAPWGDTCLILGFSGLVVGAGSARETLTALLSSIFPGVLEKVTGEHETQRGKFMQNMADAVNSEFQLRVSARAKLQNKIMLILVIIKLFVK